MSKFIDELGVIDDYSNMPKFELQQRAIFGDAKAERVYAERYGNSNKSADIEKNNPNRDSKGRFTFGSGGPQAGGGAVGAGAVEGAEQAGAAEPYEETDDYRMRHQAPTRADEFGSPATDVEEMMPGFYKNPKVYGSGYAQADKESRAAIVSIQGKPNAPVTIYRAVPESVDKINPGDWVTLSPTYAKEHLRSNVSGGKILSQVIPARDLWFDGNSVNEFGYDPVETNKSADIEKGNPNRDDRGRFTFGSGGPQAGGGGGAGGEEGGENAGGGSGGTGEPGEGKDITSELGQEYGTNSETKKAQDLREEHMKANYDPVLKDIAHKQGFDGEAEILDQEAFDKVVADGGTVTHRGMTGYYTNYGPDGEFIRGDSQMTEQYAKGTYFAGGGGYGSGTYTTSDLSVAQHYSTADGEPGGGVITMVVKPNARIATPQQWQAARLAARDGKGGFMGADNEGRILAAQGFDGFRINSKDSDHFSNQFVVVLNRKAVAVLKK
jgi:hypothetical protein